MFDISQCGPGSRNTFLVRNYGRNVLRNITLKEVIQGYLFFDIHQLVYQVMIYILTKTKLRHCTHSHSTSNYH